MVWSDSGSWSGSLKSGSSKINQELGSQSSKNIGVIKCLAKGQDTGSDFGILVLERLVQTTLFDILAGTNLLLYYQIRRSAVKRIGI